MFVELHVLQNFAPSNLNRDDTGAPKDCEFGGYRRARISSQCLKRAVRSCFRDENLLPDANLAARTKRLVEELARRLENSGRAAPEARAVVEAALKGVGLDVEKDGKTEYLVFLGEKEMSALAELCGENWDVLAAVSAPEPAADNKGQERARVTARQKKESGKAAVPPGLRKALETVLDGGKAADLALFGRMLADLPEKNIDAASQVAHAISTNRVSMEFDFYTAVDDLKPEETAGADMLGTVEFNSACFYRYANVDVGELQKNLAGDGELAGRTVEAFVRASVAAVPSGKQNSMAAQNPPSFVMAVVRNKGPLWNLANAFLRPIRADQSGDLVQNSVKALDAYWGQLVTMYGEVGVVGKWCATLDSDGLDRLAGSKVEGLGTVVQRVMDALGQGEPA